MALFEKVRNITDMQLREPREGEIIPNQFHCFEFGLPDTSMMTEKEQMEYLADILLEWYFQEYENKTVNGKNVLTFQHH